MATINHQGSPLDNHGNVDLINGVADNTIGYVSVDSIHPCACAGQTSWASSSVLTTSSMTTDAEEMEALSDDYDRVCRKLKKNKKKLKKALLRVEELEKEANDRADIEYFRKNLYAALKIPEKFMPKATVIGVEPNLNQRWTPPVIDEDINIPRRETLTTEDVEEARVILRSRQHYDTPVIIRSRQHRDTPVIMG